MYIYMYIYIYIHIYIYIYLYVYNISKSPFLLLCRPSSCWTWSTSWDPCASKLLGSPGVPDT